MKIVIDGDSQPAKDRIIETAKKYGIKTVIVTSVAHYTEKRDPYAETILVDNRKQEADIRIMNLAEKTDIVITGDVNLGLVAASKGAQVITSRGAAVTVEQLEEQSRTAHFTKKALRSKPKSGKKREKVKGPAAFTKADEDRLVEAVEKAIGAAE